MAPTDRLTDPKVRNAKAGENNITLFDGGRNVPAGHFPQEDPDRIESSLAGATFVRLAQGFVYLGVVMDWYSWNVLAFRISNIRETTFCVDCLEDALQRFGAPEIFQNTNLPARPLPKS
jgi:transposase InsO family protein